MKYQIKRQQINTAVRCAPADFVVIKVQISPMYLKELLEMVCHESK